MYTPSTGIDLPVLIGVLVVLVAGEIVIRLSEVRLVHQIEEGKTRLVELESDQELTWRNE